MYCTCHVVHVGVDGADGGVDGADGGVDGADGGVDGADGGVDDSHRAVEEQSNRAKRDCSGSSNRAVGRHQSALESESGERSRNKTCTIHVT